MCPRTSWALTTLCVAIAFAALGCKRPEGQDGSPQPLASPDQPGVEHLIEGARSALDAGDPSKAAALAQTALQARGDSLEAEELLGLALYEQGLLEEAADHLFRVVEGRQGDLGTRLACLEALDVAGRYDDAIIAARAAIEAAPDEIDGHLALGLLLLKTERFGEAIEPLENAADLAPDVASIWLHAAKARLGARQYDQAADLIDTALHVASEAEGADDTIAEATLLLAQVHLRRADDPPTPPQPPSEENGHPDQVSDEEAPADTQDDNALAASYIAEYERLADARDAQAAVGAMLVAAGRYEQARDHLDGLPRGALAEGHTAYAEALLTLGERFDVALREARLGAEGATPSAEAQAILGWALWKTGDHEGAVAALSAACEHLGAPTARARALYQLGRALDTLGRAEEADVALAEARALGYSVDAGR